MQARQLQNTPSKPFGQGHIFDISQEEYDQNPGAFRWLAEEEAAEQAAQQEAARVEQRRREEAEHRAREVLRQDMAQRITSAKANAQNLRLKRDEIDRHIKALEELSEVLQKQMDEIGLQKSETVQTVVQAQPKEQEAPRPAIDLRGGVRRIRGQS